MKVGMRWGRVSLLSGGLLSGGLLSVALATGAVMSVQAGWFSGPPPELLLSGNIEAHESVLAFKAVQSRIVELPFDEGQWVKRGTLIARLDDSDTLQQVAIAKAALAVQQRQLGASLQNLEAARKTVISDESDLAEKRREEARSRALWKSRIASTEARDKARTLTLQSMAVLGRDRALAEAADRNVELARAGVHNAEEVEKLAEITWGYTVLEAPFDGVILVRQAELGEVVMPGTPVATLADLDHVWMRAYVNETDLGRVHHGEAVDVTTDSGGGKRYRGRISFISPSAEFTPKSVETHAERVTLVYRIKIDLDNPAHELVPGQPADAHLRPLGPP